MSGRSTSGVLFMEGEGEPAEIVRIKGELQATAAGGEQDAAWLSAAMEGSWEMAKALLDYPELAYLHGERHRIIANNWQNAWTAGMIARYLRRALAVLGGVDFSPAALRADLADKRSAPGYLYSAAELINRAADTSAEALSSYTRTSAAGACSTSAWSRSVPGVDKRCNGRRSPWAAECWAAEQPRRPADLSRAARAGR
jgi:hypothetical protein